MSGFFSANVTSPFPDREHPVRCRPRWRRRGRLSEQPTAIQGQQMDLTAADHEQVGVFGWAAELNRTWASGGICTRAGWGCCSRRAWPSTRRRRCPTRARCGRWSARAFRHRHRPSGCRTSRPTRRTPTRATPPPRQRLGPPQGPRRHHPCPSLPAALAGLERAPRRHRSGCQYYEEASKETGIPVDLLIAQTRQESGFNPNAKGGAGEIGLFQIKPSTASSPGFGVPPVDPATITGPENVRNNILFGARYLKARMGGGDPSNPAVQAAGLHAYNGGGDPNYVGNVFRYRPTLAPSDPNAAVTAYTPPAAGTTTASRSARRRRWDAGVISGGLHGTHGATRVHSGAWGACTAASGLAIASTTRCSTSGRSCPAAITTAECQRPDAGSAAPDRRACRQPTEQTAGNRGAAAGVPEPEHRAGPEGVLRLRAASATRGIEGHSDQLAGRDQPEILASATPRTSAECTGADPGLPDAAGTRSSHPAGQCPTRRDRQIQQCRHRVSRVQRSHGPGHQATQVCADAPIAAGVSGTDWHRGQRRRANTHGGAVVVAAAGRARPRGL